MPIIFSTKAGTLNALKGLLQSARIAPLIFYSLSEWKLNKLSCLSNIKKNLGIGPWIVRSSCQNEDGIESSNAGKYLSILNVDTDSLEKAVEKVIESYGKTNETDQVLIQPMLNGVLRCGVAFSHDPNTCSPYRVVNWFEGSDTEAITGGASGRMWQQAAQSPIPPPKTLKPVLDLMEELLYLFDGAPLDFEFAITQEIDCQQIWLLQVRPLVLREPCEN
jgi:hypothetical protein